jgi:hypothetical protein
MIKCVESSAGTWHGMGKEREKYDFLFPKNREFDNFIVDGKFEWVESKSWPTLINLTIQVKDKITPINDVSKIQFALNLINNYEVEDIEEAMIRYIKKELPEKMI